VLLFLQPQLVPTQQALGHRLLHKLVDFQRVHLTPGETQTVIFNGARQWFELTDKVSII
jgi:hypothetical protein